jgi:hypothetical protein
VAKKLLALARLPTKWDDMTVEEQRAWCESFADVLQNSLSSETQTRAELDDA